MKNIDFETKEVELPEFLTEFLPELFIYVFYIINIEKKHIQKKNTILN